MTFRQPACSPAGPKSRLPAFPAEGRILAAILLVVFGGIGAVSAQTDERWYQIEISIFAHESDHLHEEYWPPERLPSEFPANARQLTSRMDILDLPNWDWLAEPVYLEDPLPARQSDFRLPDIDRDAFVALPASEHNFTDTNRALTASPNYRLLYHSAWRQPLDLVSRTRPLLVTGGRQFGDRHELEGGLIIGFNPGRDRVVLNTELWLSQFTTLQPAPDATLTLPVLPPALTADTPDTATTTASIDTPLTGAAVATPAIAAETTFYPTRITPVRSERAMRSREFHYLDHPAVGIVIEVFPYTPPSALSAPATSPVTEFDADQL